MYQELSQRFSDLLHLNQLPIGLAFVDTPPQGVQHTGKRVPSACTFWRLAEQGVFYATADDHQECPIGMMTMGFSMPEAAQQRAQALVQTMADVQYFSPAEVSALPVVQKPHSSILYGRLDQFPVEADVILCILDTQQGMLVAEAMGNLNWLQGGQSAFGRPTCAVIPRTMETGATSMSFGCVGARTYIDLKPSELVLTVPGHEFARSSSDCKLSSTQITRSRPSTLSRRRVSANRHYAVLRGITAPHPTPAHAAASANRASCLCHRCYLRLI